MAATPEFKVYTADGEYIAACKHIEDAAAVVALYNEGATIRWMHSKIVWKEGAENFPASESYDEVARIVTERIDEIQRKSMLKIRQRTVFHQRSKY